MINVSTKLVPGTEEFEKASAVDQYVARVINAFDTIKKRNTPAFDNWTINLADDIFSYMIDMQNEYQNALMAEEHVAYEYPSMLNTLIMTSEENISSGVFVNSVKKEIVLFKNQIKRGIEKFTVGLFSKYSVHKVAKNLTSLTTSKALTHVSEYELIQYYASFYENLFPFGIPNLFAKWCVSNTSNFDKTLNSYDDCDCYLVVFYRRTNSIRDVLNKLNEIYLEPGIGYTGLEDIIVDFYLSDSSMMIYNIEERRPNTPLILVDPDQQDVEFINTFRELSTIVDRYWDIELSDSKKMYTVDEFMNAINNL